MPYRVETSQSLRMNAREALAPRLGTPFTEKARERLSSARDLYLSGTEASDRTLGARTVFGDPVFWKAIESVPEEGIGTVISKWNRPSEYFTPGSRPVDRMRLGNRYDALLIDPGIACRIEEFIPFAESWVKANPGARLFSLRQAFSTALGVSEVYRALSIPSMEAESLQRLPKAARAQVARERGYHLSASPPLSCRAAGPPHRKEASTTCFSVSRPPGRCPSLRVTPSRLSPISTRRG